MKKVLFMSVCAGLIVFAAASSRAVDSSKPETHNTAWIELHGKAARVNEAECLTCHVERVECIACHEDVAPRNHTIAWLQKNHGLESRWNRNYCNACHREDFCTECHEEAWPMSHTRVGFGTLGAPAFHCYTSCQLPYRTWQNTPSKNCLVCHKTRPILKTGGLHAIN